MNIKDLTITEILAIWGAVISTIALIWNIIKSCKEKRELRVHATIGINVFNLEEKKLIINAVNIRKRPIYIDSIKIKFNKINFSLSDYSQEGILPAIETKKNLLSLFLPKYLPKLLLEGQEQTFNIQLEPFKDNIKDISSISILDSTGKLWSVKKSALNKLIKSINCVEIIK